MPWVGFETIDGRVRTGRHQDVPWRRRGLHGVRLLIVICLLAALPSPHAASPNSAPDSPADQDDVLSTLPGADDIVGYRGPTEAIIHLDQYQRIQRVEIGNSHDTPEHVEMVRRDEAFLDQFTGWTWGGRDADGERHNVDAVSGATLTSLAMAQGILRRLGDQPGSLVFDQPITLAEAKSIFPEASTIHGDPIAAVEDNEGARCGILIRSGDFVDDEIGYQGPTECLIATRPDGTIQSAQIRRSFDNEPYVGYVRDDRYFWKMTDGMTLDQLADLEPIDSGIEGVSGATMTSMSIAWMLPSVAGAIQQSGGVDAWAPPPSTMLNRLIQTWQSIHWSATEFATIVTLITFGILTQFKAMRQRWLRRGWLLAVWMVIGFWTGNLVSLALVAGWATAGVTWQFAIGLVCMAAVAFMIPASSRSNPYCNHLCPHGAIQQLIRPGSTSKRHIKLTQRWQRFFIAMPPMTLAGVYLLLLLRPRSDVSIFEPFHAYLWQAASWSSIVFALATIVAACCVPMAYCRFGCPTGRLIEHVRMKSTSGRWTRFDSVGLGLLMMAIGVRWLQ